MTAPKSKSEKNEKRNKAERLAIAAYCAPRIRTANSRQVKVVDVDGNVVRTISSTELTQNILKRETIELSVENERPKRRTCVCGKVFRVAKKGVIPNVCRTCSKRISQGMPLARQRAYKLPRLKCVECGQPASRESSNHARNMPGRKAYCNAHKRKPKPVPMAKCSVCGEPATKNSSYNAHFKKTKPYCAEHSPSRRRNHGSQAE